MGDREGILDASEDESEAMARRYSSLLTGGLIDPLLLRLPPALEELFDGINLSRCSQYNLIAISYRC